MRELYDALSTNNEGAEIHLSDGVWLSNDGSDMIGVGSK